MNTISLLQRERLKRNWSRAKVEAMTERRIPASSLERWEKRLSWPHADTIEVLCKLYDATAEQLGLVKTDTRDIMGGEKESHRVVPTSQEENPIVSNSVRRSALSDLGSYLFGLVSIWPRRNYHYEELQEGINKAVIDHSTLVGQDAISVMSRRQALMSLGLVPVHLIGTGKAKKADPDLVLKHCAAAITACWYLRRGKDLAFASDLTSSYISILEPLVYSHSEAYRKASATLLAQSFTLKSKLTNILQDDDQAIAYEEEAIRYALIAESITEQVITHREMALLYWWRKKDKQALPYAEKAYGLAKRNKATPKIILSFTASGLANCQAASGHLEDAQISLKEAHDLFDPTMLTPLIPYNEAILSDIDAHIYRRTGNFKGAIDIYKQYMIHPDISALGVIENNIEYAKTEVSRDDVQTRDMGLCVTLLTEAIIGARELNSEWDIRDARETYDMLRLAWPREQAIKNLGRDHFGL